MKITRAHLRRIIKEELEGLSEMSRPSKIASAEQGAYVLNGEFVTDQEAPARDQLQRLQALGVTHVVDMEADGRTHELSDWAAIVLRAQG